MMSQSSRSAVNQPSSSGSQKPVKLSSKLQPGKMKGYLDHQNPIDSFNAIQEDYIRLQEKELDAIRVVKDGFEKDNVPVKKVIETAGKKWFNFPANDSKELEKDLQMLRMRNALDPKRFYKKPEHKSGVPKFVQVGTVVTDAHDFYDRATKVERKQTIVEEMLATIESRKKLKKRFKTVKPLIAKKRRKH
ncbi:rRNA-processing protein fcf2 [Tetranychus urticae]|uniref:Fcf2 pre-rRNA processing C-terminal domain-containing protein n=1 Tax=Tetranychus urticae TaxID=32264 RepID=T1KHG7_TETUR|nr:rRNA-processing protein fcf2 [Tetranychus urticae]